MAYTVWTVIRFVRANMVYLTLIYTFEFVFLSSPPPLPLVDRTPPVVICPNNIVQEIALGQFGRAVTFNNPDATDNSGSVTLVTQSHQTGSFFQVGSTTVEFEYRDPSGNTASCTFIITIIEGRIYFVLVSYLRVLHPLR